MQTIVRYTKQFIQYVRNNRAVSALEYALLVGLLVVGIGAAIAALNTEIVDALNDAKTKVKAQADLLD